MILHSGSGALKTIASVQPGTDTPIASSNNPGTSGSSVTFDASLVARTSVETRPVNTALAPRIIAF